MNTGFSIHLVTGNPVTSRGPDIVSPVNRIANPVEVLLGDDLVLECTATGRYAKGKVLLLLCVLSQFTFS